MGHNQVMVVERDGGRTARLFDDRGRLTLEQGPSGARAESVWDERDRAVKQKMWGVAGRTALPIMLILFVVSFTSLPISLFIKVAAFAYSVVVGTARFYYDRTM